MFWTILVCAKTCVSSIIKSCRKLIFTVSCSKSEVIVLIADTCKSLRISFFLSALFCFVLFCCFVCFCFVFVFFLLYYFVFFAKKNIFFGLASRRRCFQTLRHIKLLHYMFFCLQHFLYTFSIEFTPSFEWDPCCAIFNFLWSVL